MIGDIVSDVLLSLLPLRVQAALLLVVLLGIGAIILWVYA
jgi:hypothetical protein